MSILRDKVNEMYDHLGDLSDTKFRVQVLNALYVVADQLDRLGYDREYVKARLPVPEPVQPPIGTAEASVMARSSMACTCPMAMNIGPKPIRRRVVRDGTDPLCPIHGDPRDTSMNRPAATGVCNLCGKAGGLRLNLAGQPFYEHEQCIMAEELR